MFLYFYAFESHGLVWTGEISLKKERALLTNFRNLSYWCFRVRVLAAALRCGLKQAASLTLLRLLG